jgi:hypothetical protein
MSRLGSPVALLGALVAALLGALLAVPLLAAQAQAAGPSPRLSVTVDRTEISTQLGGKFAFRSTITNNDPASVSGLIAHLNVVGLRDGVYVDPEDWSSQRTHYLEPLPAGGSTTITWHVHAVDDGVLGMYIAVLPESGVGLPPATSPMIRLTVAEKQTLNSGGIIPLALGIPALIGLLTLGVRVRRGRQPGR